MKLESKASVVQDIRSLGALRNADTIWAYTSASQMYAICILERADAAKVAGVEAQSFG